MIIGAHGAGLTNVLFSNPGTCLAELFSPLYIPSHNMQIAMSAGLCYVPIVGPPSSALAAEMGNVSAVQCMNSPPCFHRARYVFQAVKGSRFLATGFWGKHRGCRCTQLGDPAPL